MGNGSLLAAMSLHYYSPPKESFEPIIANPLDFPLFALRKEGKKARCLKAVSLPLTW